MQSGLPTKCVVDVNLIVTRNSALMSIIFTKVTQMSKFRFYLFMPTSINSDKKQIK